MTPLNEMFPLSPEELARIPPDQVRRKFDYDRRLIPNRFVAGRDESSRDLASAVRSTGLSVGYPAWNLLYYSLLCSVTKAEPVVVETGTNLGYSTIVMAQALMDAGCSAKVLTVDIDAGVVHQAEQNAAAASVADRIEFSIGDSIAFLKRIAERCTGVDFAFLDGGHSEERAFKEFELLHPLLVKARGKVYFDNSSAGGVALALGRIRSTFGGNLIEFDNCSWCPPGAAIWQADASGRSGV